MMMGGADSFHEGKYDRTPVGDMLPVYIDHVPTAPPLTNAQLKLTKEGWLQPWARLRGTEDEERQRLDAMPRRSASSTACANSSRAPAHRHRA